MKETGLSLSELLRDPQGDHRCDLVIALTHSRVSNDIRLANELGAVQYDESEAPGHGVDLILGGHE